MADVLVLVDGIEVGADEVGSGGTYKVTGNAAEGPHVVTVRARDTAERAGAGRRTDVGLRVDGQLRHAGLVAEHRSAGAGARRIDREDPDLVVSGRQMGAEGLDEGRLADAGHAGDPDADGAADVWRERREEIASVAAMVRTRGLDQRDGSGDCGPVATQHLLGEFIHRHDAESMSIPSRDIAHRRPRRPVQFWPSRDRLGR